MFYTILRTDICKLYSKVFHRAGKPNSTDHVNLSVLRTCVPPASALQGSDCLRLITETNLSIYSVEKDTAIKKLIFISEVYRLLNMTVHLVHHYIPVVLEEVMEEEDKSLSLSFAV